MERTPPHELWLIDLVAPFGGTAKVMETLRKEVLGGQAIHQLAPTPAEPARVITWPAD